MAKRRANGEGTIYYDKQRKVWVCQIPDGINPKTGKLKRKTFTAKTKREALDRGADYKAARKRGEVVKKNNILLIDWLYKYLEIHKKVKLSSNTYIIYKNMIDSYFKNSNIGNTKLQALTIEEIQIFFNNLQAVRNKNKTFLAPSTIKNIYSFLKAALKKAIKAKYINENPAIGCELPTVEEDDNPDHYRLEEIKKILDSIEEKTIYDYIIKLALATGLRQGELLALTWGNINFTKSVIEVRMSVSRKENTNSSSSNKYVKYIKSPKTTSSKRDVPIDDNVISILKRYRMKVIKDEKLNKKELPNKKLVFSNKNGDLINRESLRYNWKKTVEKAGVRYLTFHKLRASYASLLAVNGISLKGVSKLLGHSKSTTTAKYYVATDDTELRKAANITGNLYE